MRIGKSKDDINWNETFTERKLTWLIESTLPNVIERETLEARETGTERETVALKMEWNCYPTWIIESMLPNVSWRETGMKLLGETFMCKEIMLHV